LSLSIGLMVVATAIAMLGAIDRSDRGMEAVGQETAELEKARAVCLRVTQGILVAPGTDPRKLMQPLDDGSRSGSGSGARPRTRANNANAPRSDDPLPSPRIVLSADPAAGALMMPARTPVDAQLVGERVAVAGGGGGGGQVGVIPQRLEIVLTDPPVPTTVDPFEAARRVQARAARRAASREAPAEENDGATTTPEATARADDATGARPSDETEADEPEVAIRAFRGVFQFRPEEPTEAQAREQAFALERGEVVRPTFRLEWQPLRPRGYFEQDAEPPPAVPEGEPFVVARDIAYANWIFFDNGTRQTTFDATWGNDLPAYVELEIETSRGTRVNWMFEVGWAFGPEVPPPDRARRGLERIGNQGANPEATPSPSPTPPAGDGGKPGAGEGGK
jgi:hypothetical protein